MILANSDVMAMIAVKDLNAAKKFYSEVLELQQSAENPGGVAYACGSGTVFVYPTPTAGTGQSTSATWQVEDIAAAVKELRDKGITFEHYEFPGTTIEDDVHIMGEMKAAWFKDPDGNVLGLAAAS